MSSRFNAFLIPIGFVVILLMVITGIHGGKIKHNELGGDFSTTPIEQENDE